MSMPTLGQGLSLRKSPFSAMGRILLGMGVVEDKEGNLPLVVTLHIVPRSRKSTKDRKRQRRKWKCLRERLPLLHSVPCVWHIHTSLSLQPLPTTGRKGTSTYPRDLIQEEGNYYKKEVKRDRRAGLRPPPKHTKGTRKSSSDRAEDQFSLINLVHEEHRDDRCPYTKT